MHTVYTATYHWRELIWASGSVVQEFSRYVIRLCGMTLFIHDLVCMCLAVFAYSLVCIGLFKKVG